MGKGVSTMTWVTYSLQCKASIVADFRYGFLFFEIIVLREGMNL